MKLFMFSSMTDCPELKKEIKEDTKVLVLNSYLGNAPTFTLLDYYTLGVDYGNMYWGNPNLEFDELDLSEFNIIHLCGGNTFSFRDMLDEFGGLKAIREFALNGGILVGESAGSIMMCPTVEIAKFADYGFDRKDDKQDLSALNLVNFDMKPHFQDWIYAKYLFQEHSTNNNIDVYGVYDGGVIIVNGNNIIHRESVKIERND